jgi:hypothetical protein
MTDAVTTPGAERIDSEEACFVSAPAGVDLKTLSAELRAVGLRPYQLEDVARLGNSLAEGVKSAIARADLVVAALPKSREYANVLFEAGIAVGLEKPIVLIAEPGTKVPSDLSMALIIKAHLTDAEAIRFALESMPRRRTAAVRSGKPTGHPLGRYADELLGRLSDQLSDKTFTEHAAIELLRSAIDASGAIAVRDNTNLGFDLGVWADDLESIGANPLVIEYKANRDFINTTFEEHRRRNARLALFVYLNDSSGQKPAKTGIGEFPLLAISLTSLLSAMRSQSFAEVVRHLRNLAAHGYLADDVN